MDDIGGALDISEGKLFLQPRFVCQINHHPDVQVVWAGRLVSRHISLGCTVLSTEQKTAASIRTAGPTQRVTLEVRPAELLLFGGPGKVTARPPEVPADPPTPHCQL